MINNIFRNLKLKLLSYCTFSSFSLLLLLLEQKMKKQNVLEKLTSKREEAEILVQNTFSVSHHSYEHQ